MEIKWLKRIALGDTLCPNDGCYLIKSKSPYIYNNKEIQTYVCSGCKRIYAVNDEKNKINHKQETHKCYTEGKQLRKKPDMVLEYHARPYRYIYENYDASPVFAELDMSKEVRDYVIKECSPGRKKINDALQDMYIPNNLRENIEYILERIKVSKEVEKYKYLYETYDISKCLSELAISYSAKEILRDNHISGNKDIEDAVNDNNIAAQIKKEIKIILIRERKKNERQIKISYTVHSDETYMPSDVGGKDTKLSVSAQNKCEQECPESKINAYSYLYNERKVKELMHFTPFENVPSILISGILPRHGLSCEAVTLDNARLDNMLKCSCFSLTFPNYKMLSKLGYEHPNISFAILEIDMSIINDKNVNEVYYFKENAAKKTAKDGLSNNGVYAAKKMFESIVGDYSRDELKLPENITTDPQAEVLIQGIVSTNYIKSIYVKNAYDKYWLGQKVGTDFEKMIIINRALFDNRQKSISETSLLL